MAEVYTLKDCIAVGRMHGFELAESAITEGVEFDGGALTYQDALAGGITPGELSEVLYGVLWEAVDGFRQYSPFEFHAAAINRRADADAGWEAYDVGFERGARVALRAAGLGVLI